MMRMGTRVTLTGSVAVLVACAVPRHADGSHYLRQFGANNGS
jgi:hypothetical protein